MKILLIISLMILSVSLIFFCFLLIRLVERIKKLEQIVAAIVRKEAIETAKTSSDRAVDF